MFENNINKQDYIMRLAEQFSEVVIRLLSLRKQEKDGEVIVVINELFDKMLGGNELADILSYDAIIDFMLKNDDLSLFVPNCIGIADVLKIKADIVTKESFTDAYNLYQKALNIYIEIIIKYDPNAEQQKEIIEKVEEITKILNDIAFDYEQLHRFFIYYDKIEAYDKSEDYLYMMLDTVIYKNDLNNVAKVYLKEGEDFYKRLLEKDHNDLIKGNLPIDEVKNGLNELLKMFNFG